MPASPVDPHSPDLTGPAAGAAGTDPVRERRRRIARWTALANRLGYLAFGVAIAAFAVGLLTDFTSTMASISIAGLVVGTILLAPAIVLGYAIKAAERDDVERGL
jgi:hypothetical protein